MNCIDAASLRHLACVSRVRNETSGVFAFFLSALNVRRDARLISTITSRDLDEQYANRVTRISPSLSLSLFLSTSLPPCSSLELLNPSRVDVSVRIGVRARTRGYEPHCNYAGRLFIKVITPYSLCTLCPPLRPSSVHGPLAAERSRRAPFSFALVDALRGAPSLARTRPFSPSAAS